MRPVGTDVDRRTGGHDEANSRFRQFANAPKNALVFTQIIYRTRPVV